MKQFLFALAVMLSVVSPALAVSGGTTGYTEGLKIDKNGVVRALDTAKQITFPHGLAVNAANIGQGKEFYISFRTDSPDCVGNVCGSGTKFDPYDGSTRVKFEAAWAAVAASGASSLIVEPSTSPYMTNGTLLPISNCVISGYGAEIKGDTGFAVSGSKQWLVGDDTTSLGAFTNCTIQGFKFNANINNQATTTNICIGVVYFYGSFNRFIYNKVVGWGQTSSSLENFVVSPGNSSATLPAFGNEIAYNDVTQDVTPITNGAGGNTLISIGLNGSTAETFPTTKWNFKGKIHHNIIHDMSSYGGSSLLAVIGVGAWSSGQEIYENIISNIPIGLNASIYADTGLSWDAHIFNNQLQNAHVGIKLIPSSSTVRATIEKNRFLITPLLSGTYGIVVSGTNTDLKVLGNTIGRWGTSGTVAGGIQIYNSTNGIVSGNTVGTYTDHNTFQDYNGLVVRNNTFDVLEDALGITRLKTDNNRKNDGTRLNKATDTDVYQGGDATLNNVNIAQTIFGNGSGLSNVSVDAGDVKVTRRTVNDVNYTIQAGNGDYLVAFIKLTAPRQVILPAANLCGGCYRIIKDETETGSDAGVFNIGISPDIEGETMAITEAHAALKVYSNGAQWHTLP